MALLFDECIKSIGVVVFSKATFLLAVCVCCCLQICKEMLLFTRKLHCLQTF